MVLRPIAPGDHDLLREIYADAIESVAPGLYSGEQVKAWAALAWLPGILDGSFREGSGWISGGDAAFAIRHPSDRLSLLYCRGRSARQGHGSRLLDRIQADAVEEGVECLRTEASQFSRPLLERFGWTLIAPEMITIAGVPFERYRMAKSLRQLRS
jgi:GNAT superfamily N-acetyltransferase